MGGGRAARREAAGVPAQVVFATKTTLARRLLARAPDSGVPAAWVAADEGYGADGVLRRELEERAQPYVLTVASNVRASTWPPHGLPGQSSVATLAAALPPAVATVELWGGRAGAAPVRLGVPAAAPDGARGVAERSLGYDAILRHYYSNVEIATL